MPALLGNRRPLRNQPQLLRHLLWCPQIHVSAQACGREKEAIDLYKSIEANHPSRKVKKQAADLRYILEAPRLEISPDERVTIPLIQSDSWRQKE